MFALVTDIERYPEFLPWCDQGQVLEKNEAGMVARVGIAISGLRQSFTTRNTHEADRRVHMELVDGPFSSLMACGSSPLWVRVTSVPARSISS